MAKLIRQEIQSEALRVLGNSPNGVRWSDLVRTVHKAGPETPRNSVVGGLINLFKRDDSIMKISRGIYVLDKFATSVSEPIPNGDQEAEAPSEAGGQTLRPKEELFYDSFAEWLVREAEEANQAVALGGSVLLGKWGTPDVVGVRKPLTADFGKFEAKSFPQRLRRMLGNP